MEARPMYQIALGPIDPRRGDRMLQTLGFTKMEIRHLDPAVWIGYQAVN